MDQNPALRPGTVIAGKYTVEAVLGTGGMGVVVRARQAGLDRPVAIKVLLGAHQARTDIVERFYREAKAAARIRSEHVAQVFDVGETEQRAPYLAMEYLEGEDLDRRLEREGRFSLEAAAHYMQQACTGVAEAHAAGVVHRDLKPANLFVAQSNKGRALVKVIDFGISKVQEDASNLTQTQGAMGTVYYMAPEQIERPKEVDGRADVWALGVIFFQFLTGQVPYAGDTMPMVIANVLKGNRVAPSALVPGLPREVDAIVARCLMERAEDRYQTAQELGEAIGNLTSEPDARYISSKLRMPAAAAAPSARAAHAGASEVMLDPHSTPGFSGAPLSSPSISGSPSSMSKRSAAIELDGPADSGFKLEVDDPRKRPPPGFSSGRSLGPSSSPSMHRTDEPVHRAVFTGRGGRRSGGALRGLIAVGAALVVVALLAGVGVGVPRLVASSLKSAVVSGGADITYDTPRWSSQGVELSGFEATFAALPGTTLGAKGARVSLSGAELTLTDAELLSQASLEDVEHAFDAAEPSLPRVVRVHNAHVRQAVFQDLYIDAAATEIVETADGAGSRTLSFTSPSATIQTLVGNFGPFPLTVVRTPSGTELTLGTKEGANAMMKWSTGVTALALHAPRGFYAVPAKGFGVFAEDSVELALDLNATLDATGISGTGSAHVWGATIGAGRSDLSWDVELSGHENEVVAKSVKATVGPFAGEVRGEWNQSDRKHAYLKFHTAKISCADVAHARAQKKLTTLVISSIAEYAGVPVAKGDLAASGVVTIDLKSPPHAWTSLSKNETCGLTIFPSR